MSFTHVRLCSLLALGSLLAFTGCGRQSDLRGRSEPGVREARTVPAAKSEASSASLEERKASLLNRIRAADPQKATVERALINENHELGIILSRRTELDDVPKLLKAMIVQMDAVFPGEDHVAIAYTPTNPPHTVGTARSNARTRDITYQPASTP